MKRVLLVVGLLMIVSGVFAADVHDSTTQSFTVGIAEIAKISATATGNLGIIAPTTGGEIPPAVTTDGTSRVRYTSVIEDKVAPNQRKVTAEILSGVVPTGLELFVQGDTPAVDTAKGDMGAGTAAFAELTGTGGAIGTANVVDVVTSIGSCYTGILSGDGAPITYKLALDPVSITGLVASSANMVVTLTLTDDAF